jgi:hypothetical protein
VRGDCEVATGVESNSRMEVWPAMAGRGSPHSEARASAVGAALGGERCPIQLDQQAKRSELGNLREVSPNGNRLERCLGGAALMAQSSFHVGKSSLPSAPACGLNSRTFVGDIIGQARRPPARMTTGEGRIFPSCTTDRSISSDVPKVEKGPRMAEIRISVSSSRLLEPPCRRAKRLAGLK